MNYLGICAKASGGATEEITEERLLEILGPHTVLPHPHHEADAASGQLVQTDAQVDYNMIAGSPIATPGPLQTLSGLELDFTSIDYDDGNDFFLVGGTQLKYSPLLITPLRSVRFSFEITAQLIGSGGGRDLAYGVYKNGSTTPVVTEMFKELKGTNINRYEGSFLLLEISKDDYFEIKIRLRKGSACLLRVYTCTLSINGPRWVFENN